MAWYCNHYSCEDCGTAWEDEWSATCEDDCPRCGCSYEPDYSEDLPSEATPC